MSKGNLEAVAVYVPRSHHCAFRKTYVDIPPGQPLLTRAGGPLLCLCHSQLRVNGAESIVARYYCAPAPVSEYTHDLRHH
jgi:hypothetical protein